MSGLRLVVFWILLLLTLAGLVLLLLGRIVWWPWLIWSLLLLVGLAFERFAYRRTPRSGQQLERTGEVFEDPVSGKQVTVMADPRTGERFYDDSL